ncbi:MAG: ABC transporter ATP-binding protein [Acidimicrobiia bacterium]
MRYAGRDGRATQLVLDGVSYRAGGGEFVSLVGQSGCGKTTLMKICAGLLEPSGGSLAYRGRPGGPVPAEMGIVFQAPALLPWRNVLKNVLLPTQILGGDVRAARSRAMDLLDLMRLDGASRKYPSELSGGMQQRVAIARALVHDPDILFMDEPFGALDALTRDSMGAHLQTVHMEHRKTVVFVTHSIEEAVLLSDRVLVMSKDPGRIIADIPIEIPRPRDRHSVFASREIHAVETALESTFTATTSEGHEGRPGGLGRRSGG